MIHTMYMGKKWNKNSKEHSHYKKEFKLWKLKNRCFLIDFKSLKMIRKKHIRLWSEWFQ